MTTRDGKIDKELGALLNEDNAMIIPRDNGRHNGKEQGISILDSLLGAIR